MSIFLLECRLIVTLLVVYQTTCFVRSRSSTCSASREWLLRHRYTNSLYSTADITDAVPRLNFRALSERTRELLKKVPAGEMCRRDFQNIEQIMQSWAKGNSKRSALNAEQLLRRVVEEQMIGNPYADEVDMTALYQILISAWANSGESGGAERAEEILDTLQEIYEQGDAADPLLCGPDLESFNAVIHAYARSSRADAPDQALRVLEKLYDWNLSSRIFALPDKETYSAVLRSFARRFDGPKVVLKLLDHMEDLSVTYPSVKPDFRCHNAYLYALLEAVTRGDVPGREAATTAEDYLKNMLDSPDEQIRPCQWSFNMVISCWSRSGAFDMVHRAEALMHELEKYDKSCNHSSKTQPNSYSYNALMSCYSRSNLPDKGQHTLKLLRKMQRLATVNPATEPDTVSYNIVMQAFAKSGLKDAPLVVEKLLSELQETYDTTGDWRRKPNSRSVNTYLESWAKSCLPESVERIQLFIQQMNESVQSGASRLSPDKWAYNAYLQSLSKSKYPHMAEEAERVLEEMETLFKKGNKGLKPDVRTFTNVIHCIALSGRKDSVERALAVLNRMEAGDVRPSLYTYNCVINSVAKSKRAGKAILALKILRRVQDVALKPHTVSYNNVLNACAFTTHPDDSASVILKIAMKVLKEAQSGPGANWITYQTAIRVISTFEEDAMNRGVLTKDIFRECCRDGQLTNSVLDQVRFSVSPIEYERLREEATDGETGELRRNFTVCARRSMLERKTKTVEV